MTIDKQTEPAAPGEREASGLRERAVAGPGERERPAPGEREASGLGERAVAGPGERERPAPGERGTASPIAFRLDHASGVPTYLQLVQQVEHALRLGYLVPGDRLPTVKEAVGSLAINPNTVLKAYRELEHRDLASGHPGQGTFVRGTPGTVVLPELTALRKTLLAWLRSADAAGLDEAGLVALFTSTLRDFRGERDAVPPGRRGHDHRGETPVPGPRDSGRGQAETAEGAA